MNIYRHITSKAELEREYSPSSCVTNLAPLLAAYGSRSGEARTQFPQFQTLKYGAADCEAVDFFPAPSLATAKKPRPTVIYIHGGYWQELSKNEHSFPALQLARHDISYVAVNYGLAPASTMNQMMERCRQAVAWIARQPAALGIDPTAIHLAGCSAGGHLAAMTMLADWAAYGLERNPIMSVTLLSGVYDLEPIVLTYVNDAVGLTAEQARRNSPLLLLEGIAAPLPPALVVYAENETSEFKRQSADFAQALRRKKIATGLHCIPERNHFDLIFDLGDEATVFGKLFLDHIGRNKP